MLPTASLSISNLLSNPFHLNIPLYQRPFAWSEDVAEQLFDDLLEAANLGLEPAADPGYFLGTILLMDSPGSETTHLSPKMPPRDFDIVDGQQRLVTLMTLFAVLRDGETNGRRPIGKRVQAMFQAQQGSRFFRTERLRLQLQGRDREHFDGYVIKPGGTLESPLNADASERRSQLLAVRDRLKTLSDQLSEDERARLFAFVADRSHVVVIVSNDIDRAHRLFVVLNERGKKLQRNDILKADLLSRLPAADIARHAKRWDEVDADLGEDFEHLFGHIRTIYGYTRPQIVSGVRAVVTEAGGAGPFLEDVFKPLSEAYALIRRGGNGSVPPAMSRHLLYLNRMPDGDWAPAAMLALRNANSNPARATALLAEIDRFAHLMRLLCAGTGKRVRRFADVIAAMRADGAVGAAHPAFQLTREEQRSIAFHMKDLHKRNPKACKLLLLRLSDEMSNTISDINPDDYTIEHVLPQRPSASSEWRRWFPTAEERGHMVESLGNLVLISQSQNDKARNATWSAKKDIYRATNSRIPLLSITSDVLDVEEWRAAEIQAREAKLVALIDRIWRTDFAASVGARFGKAD